MTECKTKRKLMVLGDSPTIQTGFGRVMSNLLKRWKASGEFDEIWVWAIGYSCWPDDYWQKNFMMCPANTFDVAHWHDPRNLRRFLVILGQEGFTHLFMLQDLFLLNRLGDIDVNGKQTSLGEVCAKNRIHSTVYYPVDAPLDRGWVQILNQVDRPVAYTNYGLEETQTAFALDKIEDKRSKREAQETCSRIIVIPHGTEKETYHPLTPEERIEVRHKVSNGYWKPSDFIIINVNKHQKRKGLVQTLMTYGELCRLNPQRVIRLHMHMMSEYKDEGTNLRVIADQLGLDQRRISYGDGMIVRGLPQITEKELNEIYNACDLYLTTSLGEGWGLPITEAMAAGLPVAGPRHTAIAEIMAEDRGILFEIEGWDWVVFDNNRLRPRSDANDAAMKIHNAMHAKPEEEGSLVRYAQRGHDWAVSEYLDWDRIAGEFITKAMEIKNDQ